jgi:hypothetical protein
MVRAECVAHQFEKDTGRIGFPFYTSAIDCKQNVHTGPVEDIHKCWSSRV